MSDNWNAIRQEVHTYRNYVHKLPEPAAKKASYCYLLTKEEIDRLLNLKGDGHLLHGIRIYLGAEMIEGHMVPNVHIVACDKDGDQYNDYAVPGGVPHVAMAAETGLNPLMADSTKTSTGGTVPCPNFCSGSNILNS
jgi:hypothetical protein